MNTEEKSCPHGKKNASVLAGTTWKSSVIAVRVNIKCYYQSWNKESKILIYFVDHASRFDSC